jgi:hypothetical protein
MDNITFFDIILYMAIAAVVYKIVSVIFVSAVTNVAASMIMENMPIDSIFPIRLEYTNDQWFAWDYDQEFIGQAATKNDLLEKLAAEMNYPKDKFQIISEYPVKKVDVTV